jgi:hypothetical protein
MSSWVESREWAKRFAQESDRRRVTRMYEEAFARPRKIGRLPKRSNSSGLALGGPGACSNGFSGVYYVR